ncbi:uncharacterized protein [Epargyreus clarus]|uniref:uncharacterized protein isoform X2 n=1 Tax=Epargyreus clarus TaxID=520877 RepID=UPI003C2D7484
MSFELGEPKPPDEMFFESKTAQDRGGVEDFPNDMVAHKDLFETISEAHYLPELGGPHDEALLESLVEKGCEDNQILGQTLDKLANLVHGSGEYQEVEEDILLSGAPVADIIDRLESLESPGRSSITAAQGLLHLHHIGDHLPPPEHREVDQSYIPGEVYVPDQHADCAMDTLAAASELQEANQVNHIDYDQNADKRLENNVEATDVMYTEPVPEAHETFNDKTFEESQPQSLPDQSEMTMPSDTNNGNVCEDICPTQRLETGSDDAHSEISEQNNMENNAANVESNDFTESLGESTRNEETTPTDLSVKHVEHVSTPLTVTTDIDTSNTNIEDNLSDKSDEQPRDLSVHRRLPTPHASPRRMDLPRAPSRESDAMQSPQPSGIPAVPSSPEIFTMPPTKSKHTLFLESLLSSPSPKMYTSEVTITKQQCEPLNLGKHRKSASPTITSCSDEMRKLNKEFGEPQEKRQKRHSTEDLAKISKVYNMKCSDDQVSETVKCKKASTPTPVHKSSDETSPLKQLQVLKTSPDFNIPDPLLVPKERLNHILAAPGREIPALLIQRPELRLPEAFAFPAILQDPDILVVSLTQLENILENDLQTKKLKRESKEFKSETKDFKEKKEPTSTTPKSPKSTSSGEKSSTPQPQPDQTTPTPQPRNTPNTPNTENLAGDIDAATSAAFNHMMWLPYLSQLEALNACSQNMDFMKALNSSGYNGPNYSDLSQAFNPAARFMGPGGFPMMPPMDYENRLQFAMWQEAMARANASSSGRPKSGSMEAPMKDMSKSSQSDVQNPYVHSTKNHQSKTQAARTSPIAHNYNNQRSMGHNPFLQGMYPGMNPNLRPNMPLPGLQIPYFNPQMMGSQRSPRTGQQKSPTSPFYPNNNYLQAYKQSEQGHPRSGSAGSQDSPRPRISVKSLQNLMDPAAAGASGVPSRRASTSASSMGRRREETEVGSTTPLGEPPPHMPPHPHDPASFHLWHPLFGKRATTARGVGRR